MKASSATSAKATPRPRPTARSSARPPPTRTSAESFALTGPSGPLDPDFNAFRKDLADVALAGRVIASHYAEPVKKRVMAATIVRRAASDESEAVGELEPGDAFAALDDTVGWAWGYAGDERRVGYVRSDALSG